MAETWRVVLATGEVLSVECLYIGTVALAKVYGLRAEGVAVSGQGDNFVEAILDLARDGMLRVVEILAPGEPTRAELLAHLAAVTAERDVLRAQQAPLVACVDALRAAARDAGWRDADATGETLVAWVRRGEREACVDAITARLAEAVSEVREKTYRGTGAERDTAAAVRDAIEAVRDMIREGGE